MGNTVPSCQGRTTVKRRHVQRSGPRKPLAGAGVGGTCCSAPCVRPPPFGPGRHPPVGTSLGTPRKPASGPITARFQVISQKLSQNRVVSPEMSEKASHSPYFQNGSEKSPLEILRFPFSRAFSHKELLGHFGPYLEVYCQNDEVSPDCTPDVPAKWTARYPHRPRQQAASCGLLLIWPGAVSQRYSH